MIVFPFFLLVCKRSCYAHLYVTWHMDSVSLLAEILIFAITVFFPINKYPEACTWFKHKLWKRI